MVPRRSLFPPRSPSFEACSACTTVREIYAFAELYSHYRPPPRAPLPSPRYPAALEMTRHFFQEEQLGLDHAERLETVFNDRRQLTPAVVEQLAGECDTIGDFVAALEALPFSRPCA